MSWLPSSERAALRDQVRHWLIEHHDPRDPLALPVSLLLEMFLAATSLRGLIYPIFGAAMIFAMLVGAGAALVAWVDHEYPQPVIVVRADEQPALQQWAAVGEMSRLMRCDSPGLIYQGGRCHTAPGAGWLIPLPAQQRLASEGHDQQGQPAAATSEQHVQDRHGRHHRREDTSWQQ